MNKYFRRTFIRNDNKEIFLYGYKEHKEAPDKQLEIKNLSKPHMRWHPFRQEWVTYSPGRENRISFPSKDYCPLCPSAKIGNPTEVPFKNFEIVVVGIFVFLFWKVYSSQKRKRINKVKGRISQ